MVTCVCFIKGCVHGQLVISEVDQLHIGCRKCRLGKHGGSINGSCIPCGNGNFSSQEGQSECELCEKPLIPNNESAGCVIAPWLTIADCKYESEYFNGTDTNPNNHDCISCPFGAWCKDLASKRVRSAANVQPKAGYWRVPWSVKNNISLIFVRCPFSEDCLGYPVNVSEINNDKFKKKDLIVDPCLLGTRGPLCSVCLKGYNRDVLTCNECPEAAFAARVGVLFGVLFLLVGILYYFRKQIETRWKKYRSLTGDVLRVFSINVTFAQINSSMTSVIEIQWPNNWHNFVGYLNFVNIDIMSLVGAKCIGDFDYYGSFSIMLSLPVIVFVVTVAGYNVAVAASKRKMNRLTNQQETDLHREALRKLFEFADSGKILLFFSFSLLPSSFDVRVTYVRIVSYALLLLYSVSLFFC